MFLVEWDNGLAEIREKRCLNRQAKGKPIIWRQVKADGKESSEERLLKILGVSLGLEFVLVSNHLK